MSDPLCQVCGITRLSDPEARARRACHACALELGLYAFGPPQRPDGPCRRCSWHEIVRARIPEAYTRDGMTDTWMRPLALYYRTVRGALTTEHDTESGVGRLEAYVCRRCGYTEIFCAGAEQIPVGPEHGTQLLDYRGSAGGPFR